MHKLPASRDARSLRVPPLLADEKNLMSWTGKVRDYIRDGMSEADAYKIVAAERNASIEGGETCGVGRTPSDLDSRTPADAITIPNDSDATGDVHDVDDTEPLYI